MKTRSLAPAVGPGPLGSWDDFKAGSPVVLEEDGGYRLWYRGCHFLGADYGCGVGQATSKDGVAWQKGEAPVFVPADPFEREHLDAIAVARGKDGYVLWYSVSSAAQAGRHRATIRAARSKDGRSWVPAGAVVYEAVSQGWPLRPVALWRDGRYHLWLVDSRSAIDPKTRLFPEMPSDGDDALLHFVSEDGMKLTPAGSTPTRAVGMGREALWVGPEPSGGFRALFYEQTPSGSARPGVAVLRSADGSNWERAPAEAMPLPVSDLNHSGPPGISLSALPAKAGLFAWFGVRSRRGSEAIRVAFRKEAT